MENQILEQTTIKRFDLKNEAGIIKAISKILNVSQKPLTEEQAISKESIAIINPSNILMIVGKSEESKRVLSRFVDFDSSPQKVPELSYKGIGVCKYSIEFLMAVTKVFSYFDGESITISVSKDYPGTFENEHFKVIIAPRVETD
jgi:hypothetical protein